MTYTPSASDNANFSILKTYQQHSLQNPWPLWNMLHTAPAESRQSPLTPWCSNVLQEKIWLNLWGTALDKGQEGICPLPNCTYTIPEATTPCEHIMHDQLPLKLLPSVTVKD